MILDSFGMAPAITPNRAFDECYLNRRIDETTETYHIFDNFIAFTVFTKNYR